MEEEESSIHVPLRGRGPRAVPLNKQDHNTRHRDDGVNESCEGSTSPQKLTKMMLMSRWPAYQVHFASASHAVSVVTSHASKTSSSFLSQTKTAGGSPLASASVWHDEGTAEDLHLEDATRIGRSNIRWQTPNNSARLNTQ